MDELMELRRRVEVLERYVALSMSSSGSFWDPHTGLQFNPGPNSDATDMIMGYRSWNPRALDKGG